MMCGGKGRMSPFIGVELAPGRVDLMTASSGVRGSARKLSLMSSMAMAINCLKNVVSTSPEAKMLYFRAFPCVLYPTRSIGAMGLPFGDYKWKR